jgi:hypothetical protein
MTFRAERYPKDWKAIRAQVLARADERCECRGECGDAHDNGPSVGRSDERHRCRAPNGASIVRDPRTPAVWWRRDESPYSYEEEPRSVVVVLTVAHLDHDERHNDLANLRALCQRCHLKLDNADNRARRREREAADRGQQPLPSLAVMPEHRRIA